MSDSGPGRREVAYRLFAAEFDDAEFSYSESDEERSPNYVVTPTGARVNRLFAVGVLTEVDDVNPEMVRGRIVDPTGAFVSYAGQYQPDALAFLERADPPSFVALSGKARTFEPDDGDQIYTSVRPESISEVDAETRDRWVVTTAERTIDRIGVMASAIEAELSGDQLRAALVDAGIDERLADGVALALDYYGTTPAYLDALRETALDAARVVAGERDEVRRIDLSPGEGMGDASELATLDLSDAPSPATAAAAAGVEGDGDVESEAEAETATEPAVEESAEAEAGTGTETEAVAETEEPETAEEPESTEESTETEVSETTAETESVEETEAEPETEPETESEPEPETTETTAEAESGVQEPGEFESEEEVREEVEEELEDFDPGEFDLDDETREQVEEEYGTEFSTADEVEEAGIETPEAETSAEEGASEPDEIEPEAEAAEGEEISEPSSKSTEEPAEPEPVEEESAEEAEAEEDAEPAGEVDLEDAVMETMEELDEGDGADHDELVATVAESHGVAADDVEEAIQDALMSGRCYEPSDGTLKSI